MAKSKRSDKSAERKAIQLEALRIASQTVRESASSLEKIWPTSPLIERLRVFADGCIEVADYLASE